VRSLRLISALVPACLVCACSDVRSATKAGPAAPSSASSPSRDTFIYECTVGGNDEICTVPAGGGAETPVAAASDPASDMYPRWTRDGRAIVFSSERGGRWQIWQADPVGTGLRRLRETAAREWQSDPHPDGRQVVFLSDAGGEESVRVDEDARGPGRALALHGAGVVLGNPHWSPDGASVVFSSNRGRFGHKIFLLDAATKAEKRLSPAMSSACEPRFSPDGTRVVYVRRHHITRERSAIVEHDLRTGQERLLVEWPALNYDPTYSPDGKELAFVSDRAGGGVQAIYRMRLADGQSWRVTSKYPARHPDYRPR